MPELVSVTHCKDSDQLCGEQNKCGHHRARAPPNYALNAQNIQDAQDFFLVTASQPKFSMGRWRLIASTSLSFIL